MEKNKNNVPETPSIKRRADGAAPSGKSTKLHVGMLGSSSVGKTSLIKRFVYGDKFDPSFKQSTIGVD
jgi:GTPase SAR1 family protein